MARYMIRIRREEGVEPEAIIERLELAGAIVDREFAPVPLDAEGRELLIRGEVPRDRASEIAQSEHVELFPDPEIGPLGKD